MTALIARGLVISLLATSVPAAWPKDRGDSHRRLTRAGKRPRLPAKRRRNHVAHVLILLLLASLTGLFPLAAASPSDPAWIPGIYDGADYDDVVSLVTSSEAGDLEIRAALGGLPGLVGPRASLAADSVPRVAPQSTLRLRSPPNA